MHRLSSRRFPARLASGVLASMPAAYALVPLLGSAASWGVELTQAALAIPRRLPPASFAVQPVVAGCPRRFRLSSAAFLYPEMPPYYRWQ